MRGPHVRFSERREGAILRAYSTAVLFRRHVFVGESLPFLHRRLVLPMRIVDVDDVTVGDEALRLLEPGGFQDGRDRWRNVAEIANGVPAEIVGLADRLRGEFRRR